MMLPRTPELILAAARFALGKLTSEDAIAAASATLNRGIYSQALGDLILREAILSEVEPLFVKALSELGIDVPSRIHALDFVAREYARQIVDRTMSPYQGARCIWWEVAIEADADRRLLCFVGLASEWEDDPHHRNEYEADIIQEARQFLAR